MNTTTEESSPAVAVATAPNEAVRNIWKQLLEKDGFSDDEEFYDLGGNSVLLMGMLEVIQDQFDREIALDDLADGVTVSRIAALLS